MFKNIIIIVVLSILVISCSDSGKPRKPDNLISKDKMSEILYDLYIINAAKGVNRKLLETNGFIPETYVLTKYNIDSTQFANSNVYYAFNTDDYKVIVEQVKSRLEKEKEEFEELQRIEGKAAQLKRDSVNKIKQRTKDSIKKRKRDTIIKWKKDSMIKGLDSTAIN